jgi:outer membrane protein assembly factor BamB
MSTSTDRAILVMAGDSKICGYDRTTGRLVWQYVQETKVFGLTARIGGAIELAIHEGRVIAALHDRLVCLDYRTGAVIGEAALGSVHGRPTFVIDEDRMFVATRQSLDCFTLDGRRIWSAPREADSDGAALGFPGNVRQGDERGT